MAARRFSQGRAPQPERNNPGFGVPRPSSTVYNNNPMGGAAMQRGGMAGKVIPGNFEPTGPPGMQPPTQAPGIAGGQVQGSARPQQGWNYDQLMNRYQNRLNNGRGGQQFLQNHPRFANRMQPRQIQQRPQGDGRPGSPTGMGPGHQLPGQQPAPQQPVQIDPSQVQQGGPGAGGGFSQPGTNVAGVPLFNEPPAGSYYDETGRLRLPVGWAQIGGDRGIPVSYVQGWNQLTPEQMYALNDPSSYGVAYGQGNVMAAHGNDPTQAMKYAELQGKGWTGGPGQQQAPPGWDPGMSMYTSPTGGQTVPTPQQGAQPMAAGFGPGAGSGYTGAWGDNSAYQQWANPPNAQGQQTQQYVLPPWQMPQQQAPQQPPGGAGRVIPGNPDPTRGGTQTPGIGQGGIQGSVRPQQGLNYNQLLNRYNNRRDAGRGGQQFLENHPRFANRMQGKNRTFQSQGGGNPLGGRNGQSNPSQPSSGGTSRPPRGNSPADQAADAAGVTPPGEPNNPPPSLGLPNSPEYIAIRRALDDELSATLLQIGVARDQIPAAMKLIEQELLTDQGLEHDRINEDAASRGIYQSGIPGRNRDLADIGFGRQWRGALDQAQSQYNELAQAELGAQSDWRRGIQEALLDYSGGLYDEPPSTIDRGNTPYPDKFDDEPKGGWPKPPESSRRRGNKKSKKKKAKR